MTVDVLVPDDRLVRLSGAQNFREVGGYPTEDGRRLRRGLLWRSGRLDGLTEGDAEILRSLGIRLIADLRRANEREQDPPIRAWPGDETRVVHWEDINAVAPSALAELQIPHGRTDAYLNAIIQYYRALPEAHIHRLKDLYEEIASGTLPILIHCAAGKDRTGFAVALLLKLLGVRHDYVIDDYVASERMIDYEKLALSAAMAAARSSTLDQMHTDARALILRSDARYLQASLAHIEERYGSIGAFASKKLDLSDRTLDQLRSRLLET